LRPKPENLRLVVLRPTPPNRYYTTTPRLAIDDLTAKLVTGANDLTLKTYSDKLLLPV
jgi:hypothetical protein